MVDHGFYSGVYMGSRIPEAAFNEFSLRAGEALDRLKRYYTVTGGQESEKLALCAMAEHIYDTTGRRGGVSSASAGSVSVKYADSDRGLYDAAAVYLEISRGVG